MYFDDLIKDASDEGGQHHIRCIRERNSRTRLDTPPRGAKAGTCSQKRVSEVLKIASEMRCRRDPGKSSFPREQAASMAVLRYVTEKITLLSQTAREVSKQRALVSYLNDKTQHRSR